MKPENLFKESELIVLRQSFIEDIPGYTIGVSLANMYVAQLGHEIAAITNYLKFDREIQVEVQEGNISPNTLLDLLVPNAFEVVQSFVCSLLFDSLLEDEFEASEELAKYECRALWLGEVGQYDWQDVRDTKDIAYESILEWHSKRKVDDRFKNQDDLNRDLVNIMSRIRLIHSMEVLDMYMIHILHN